jgi:glutamyl-Q tRNA(Asp) synthetase
MPSISNYRGRFAPSPTGPLHFGSLVAALASYLDARHHGGAWLLRMEDLDEPRTFAGAATDILHTLESFGLHWDEEVVYQSHRTDAYDEALQKLEEKGAVYPCACTRKEIADSALHGIEGQIYPGTCRKGIPAGREGRAWRVRTDNVPSPPAGEGVRERGRINLNSPPSPIKGEGCVVEFDDMLQGYIVQNLEREIGDFVVRRADGLFAYQLAVVVDDAFQRITHVVRGADLLNSTPRQIYLQKLLGLPTPSYMHIPIAVNAAGEKLSKQTLATPVMADQGASILCDALEFLRQHPPLELRSAPVEEVLQWGIANWQPRNMTGLRTLPAVGAHTVLTGTRAASAHSSS